MKKILFIVSLIFLSFIIKAQIVSIPDANFKSALLSDLAINTNGDSEIQVSEAKVVRSLIVSNKNIADLTGIEAFTGLLGLNCSNNNLSSLNVKSSINLNTLDCSFNNLTSLDLNLYLCQSLRCQSNSLASVCINPNHLACKDHCIGCNNWLKDPSCLWDSACSAQTMSVYIPDSNFKNALLNDLTINTNNDTAIQVNEAQKVQYLSVGNQNIGDLTGIGAFSFLIILGCENNHLSQLDVSANRLLSLACPSNQISQLTLNNTNIELEAIECSDNLLSQLDVTAFDSLKFLNCTNNQISQLSISPNSRLTLLYCDSNQLAQLNLNVVNTLGLTDLNCSSNQLSQLDVSTYPSLINLDCSNNLLSQFDISACASLQNLICSNNQLNPLELGTNASIIQLDCSNNQLAFLDVSKNINLDYLTCDTNNLNSVCINSKQWDHSINDYWNWIKDYNCEWSTSNCADSSASCFALYVATYDTLQNEFTLAIDPISSNKAISYKWDFGDGTISTLDFPTHTYTKDTIYNICMKIYTAAGDSCEYCHNIGFDEWGNMYRTAGFTVVVTHPTSLTVVSEIEENKNTFSVSPNPTTGSVKVVFSQIVNNTTIKLISLAGQNLFEQSNLNSNQLSIDIINQASGMYILEVNQQGLISRVKLIKE